MNSRNGLSYLNSGHNSWCFLNYSQQFDVQEFLGKDKVEFWTWKEQKNGTVFDTGTKCYALISLVRIDGLVTSPLRPLRISCS